MMRYGFRQFSIAANFPIRKCGYNLLFFPCEMFSEYLNNIDVNKGMLISYTNGYVPYTTSIDFAYIAFAAFLDSLDDDIKRGLIAITKELNDEH